MATAPDSEGETVQDSLDAEHREPLLGSLRPFLGDDRRLIVAREAVDQFEVLIGMFAGPEEQQRWDCLKTKLEVFSASDACTRALRIDAMEDVASLTKVAHFAEGDLCLADAATASLSAHNGHFYAQDMSTTLPGSLNVAA